MFTINLPVKIDSEEAFLKYLQPYYSVREETDMWPYKGERYIVAVCEDMVTYFFDHKEQGFNNNNSKGIKGYFANCAAFGNKINYSLPYVFWLLIILMVLRSERLCIFAK